MDQCLDRFSRAPLNIYVDNVLYLVAFFYAAMMFDTYFDCEHVADLRELSRPTYFPLIYANPGMSCQHYVNIVCDFLGVALSIQQCAAQNSLGIDTFPPSFPAGGLSEASYTVEQQQQT